MNFKGLSRLLLLAATAGLLLGCDKASPVAPDGTTVTLTANPSQISTTGTSTITAIARKPGGIPVLRGTEIRFSTDIGTIDTVVEADDNGIATATFRGDGRTGAAKITANTGSGATASAATVNVQVGQSSASKPVVLVSVNPSNIPVGGTATVTVIGRNADGTLVSGGANVILTTTLGALKIPGATGNGSTTLTVTTGADGTATATLAAGNQAGTATVTALLGTSDAGTATLTIRDAATAISVQANPSFIPVADGTVALTAFVVNSQGQALQGAPVTFRADKGTLANTGAVFTDSTGIATNTLTVKSGQLTSGERFGVTATTPKGDGSLLSNTAIITVQ